MSDHALRIAFENWADNPAKKGYLKWNGAKTASEIEDQIHKVLKLIPFTTEGSSYEHAEWISMHGKYDGETFEVPKYGKPIVTWYHGCNEGYIVEITLRDSSGMSYEICRIKYLSGQNEVHGLTYQLIEALCLCWYGYSETTKITRK